MIKFIIGENNSGKSRYLRKEYTKDTSENELDKLVYSFQNPKYFVDNKINILDEEYEKYYDTLIFDNIYTNGGKTKNLINETSRYDFLSSKGLDKGNNFSYDGKIFKFEKNKIILKILLYIYEKEEYEKYNGIVNNLFFGKKDIKERSCSIFIPTIRNIQYGKESEFENAKKYMKMYNLYYLNLKVLSNRMNEIKNSFINNLSVIEAVNKELEKINFKIIQSEEDFYTLKIKTGEEIKYSNLGDGYIQLVDIVSEVTLLKNNYTGAKKVYIDEFNISFHPKLSKLIIEYFLTLDEFEFILSVHSVDFLDKTIIEGSNINLFKIKNKDSLELEELELVEAYNLLDIDEIKNLDKNIVFVESEKDAKVYKQFAKILKLENVEFIGLRGKEEIPKVINRLNQVNVYGIVDHDDNDHKVPVADLIKSGKIFQYEEMYTLENILFNPVNLKNLLGLDIAKSKKDIIKNNLCNQSIKILYNKEKEMDKYFTMKKYADYLKDYHSEIIVEHCYKNDNKEFIEMDKTYLKIKVEKFITNKNNFPIGFVNMLTMINELGGI